MKARWILAAALPAAAACTPPKTSLDLLRAESALVEASVVGQLQPWVVGQFGKQLRLNDVVLRTIPASPPSRLRFRLDIPAGARLELACGIPAEHHEQPGVEFVLKLKRDEREEPVWSLLLDPLSRPAHRKWVHASVDLAAYAGRGRELILETRGYEQRGDVRRAFWGAPTLTAAGAQAPLTVVYLVDTLRADHTQPYGYERDTTPALLQFAADGVVFEKAIAHASWTKPSVASILTSLLPGRHRAVQLRDQLDPGLVTLAEMLQTKGHATGAAIANSVIYAEGTNFEQGFDHYAGLHGADDRPSKLVDANVVVDEALRFLDTRRGLPTFLYVHTMDPHVPYQPPPAFEGRYAPHPSAEHPAVDPRTDYKEALDRDRLIAQYDACIAFGDQEFGRFLNGLKGRGLYQRSLIVFLADHGEEFLDHGQWTHGKTVFDELVHIPLVVKFPDGRDAGRRVPQQVQAVDVLPTVLRAREHPVPPAPVIVGRPLQSVLEGGAPEAPAVSEISHRGFVAHGMRTNRDKYVRRFSPQEDELYFDLLRDPREQKSLLEQSSDRVRQLRAGVEAAMVPNPFRHNVKLVGPGEFVLTLRTGGWIEGVQPGGFGAQERYEVAGNGRKLLVRARPQPGRPRELAFSVRPMGAPVWIEGSWNARALRPENLWFAEEGLHPHDAALRLPEIEPIGETDRERLSSNIFAAPRQPNPGVHVWLTMTPGLSVMNIGKEACERLRALGYISGTCPG